VGYKKSPALFQGRSLVEQMQFLYSVLIAFPPPVQNISTALFRLHTIVVMRFPGTGKTPCEDMKRTSYRAGDGTSYVTLRYESAGRMDTFRVRY
jgi:hypothetical protein